jgi:hypothetical protein
LPGTNALANLASSSAMKNVLFITLTPGRNLTKLLRPYFRNVSNELVFVPGKPILPSLMFEGKAESLS